MAKFFANMDASLLTLSQMTDENKWSILQPAAEIAKIAFSDAVQDTFQQHTGALAKSPVAVQKTKDGTVFALIQLKGKHPKSSTGVRMKKGRNGKRRKSGRYSGTNAEVGYFLNYGTPRITNATHWYDKTEEKIAPQVQDKIEEGFNAYLEEQNL